MNEQFMKHCLCTYTHTPLDPLAPRQQDIKAEDIAHALSLICRSNGHTSRFYSVAQHSLNCAAEAQARGLGARLELACLLHDASEAYIADIVRPVKHNLPDYLTIEAGLQGAIFEKYGLSNLSDSEQAQIRSIDDRILRCEFLELIGVDLANEDSPLRSAPDLRLRPFAQVEAEFLDRLGRLAAACGEAAR